MSTERVTGRVKWFNNKAGYGFITVTDGGDRNDSDVFVHHKAIVVSNEQYKYLVQGEYVEFSMIATQEKNHEFQAGDVSGIRGGLLMCETRRDVRSTRTKNPTFLDSGDNQDSKMINEPVKLPRSVNMRGSGPRENDEWITSSKVSTDNTLTNQTKRRGRPPRDTSSQQKSQSSANL